MSKQLKYILLSAGVLASSLGLTTALATRGTSLATTAAETVTTSSGSITLVNEVVYVFANPDGSTRKIVSSDWTRNLNLDEFSLLDTPDKKTPLDLKISYKLDGQAISATNLVGKSGHVEITYDFKNKERLGAYYSPYVVISGLILDNSNFKNISSHNSKIINDGSRTIIVGVAMPGMQENLGIPSSSFEIPSSFSISADVTNFKLDMSISLVTNEIFTNLDVSGLNSIDELSVELNKLTDAMDKILSGSSDLAKGLEELYQKAKALPDGIATLASGSEKLAAGAQTIDASVGLLNSKLTELASNNDALNTGAKQTFESILATTETSLRDAGLPITTNLTIDNYTAVLAGISAYVDAQPAIPDAQKTAIKTQINTAKAKLDSYNQFYLGLKQYTAGVAQISAAISNPEAGLKQGTTSLAQGASSLSDGLSTLNSSAPALISGIEQLRDGSIKLSSGLKDFNEQGIQKLINFYQGNVQNLIYRIRTISNLAKENHNKSRFVYRIDEIK